MIKVSITAIFITLCVSPAFAGDILSGQEIYMDHCAMCHGITAQGDGPMVPALMIKPKNLTQLSSENDGVFPLSDVIKRIDGREGLVSHGSPMPVYGYFFEGQEVMLKTDAGQPVLTSHPIDDLITWLKTLQR